MVDSDVVSNYALNEWHDRAAHDRHIQNAGTISCQRAEFGYSQTADAREHNRIDKSDSQNTPHGDVSAAQHRNDYQYSRADRTQHQQVPGSNPA